MRLAIASTVLMMCAACLPTPVHHCASNDDCGGGSCVLVAEGDSRCAADDGACTSGLRWNDDAGDLGGACVDGAAPRDWDPCLVQPYPVNHLDDSCAQAVCDTQARCCTREWNQNCVALADRVCDLWCGGVAAFVGVDETWVGGWDGNQFSEFWSDDNIAGHDVDAVAWGDYDNDALPDFATCDDGTTQDSAIRIYHNEGDGNFALARAVPSGMLCWDIDFVDLDGDGGLDIVANGTYQGAQWVRNDHGLWSDEVDAVEQAFVTDIDWADYDGDGKMDAAVARYEDSMHVDRNTGGPAFTTAYDSGDSAASPRYQSVTWGDVNAIGGLDLAVAGEGFVRVFPNTDSNGFAAGARLLEGPASDVDAIRFLDADEDGDLDLVVASNDAPIRTFRNDDNGGVGIGFTATPLWSSGASVPFTAPIEDVRLAIGDVDHDGHEDLLICSQGDYCQLWSGQGDGTYVQTWDPPETRPIEDVALTNDWRR